MPPFVFFDKGPDGRPALFCEPSRIVEAYRADAVEPAFEALELALREGCWVAGYCAYELGYVLEPSLTPLLPPARRGPLLQFGVFGAPSRADRLEAVFDSEADAAGLSGLRRDWDRADYARAFEAVGEGIARGDFYQVNLTMPLRMRLQGSATSLYGALRRQAPAGHGAFVNLGAPALLSRSPELFFEILDGRMIGTRPMKGTAPRGASPQEDEGLRRALETDEKNRAENLMIVDLLRNDLARISEPGSVSVPKLFEIESYPTVHQMVSSVQSRLAGETGLPAVLRSLFPSGSVTGAPKIAAMQAIRALEAGPREAYCGAIGWASPQGLARFSVAIRTLLLHADGEIVLNVGGGVVADSTADGEYEEALWKARFVTPLLKD
jgi:para-aminobenzoate synthetase component 1